MRTVSLSPVHMVNIGRRTLVNSRRRLTTRVPGKTARTIYRVRSAAIRHHVLRRADGDCEGYGRPAPFRNGKGAPYLEPHHTTRLSDEGPDHPARVIALCPNCHRRAHYSNEARQFNLSLKKKLAQIECVG
jgi:5-methylcytosine-specific restriction enzyme A